jgi:hypothetical protein
LWSLRARPLGRRWQPAVVAALAAGAIAIPWYLTNLPALTAFWRSQSWFALMEQEPGWTSLKGWGYYLGMLPSTQLFVPLSLFFGLGLLIVVLRWKDWANKRGAFLLAVWFCLPYVAFTLLPNKNTRYTLPLLPVPAIVSALGLSLIRSTAARRAAQTVMVGCALVQFVGLTVGLHDRFPQIVPKTLALTEGLRPLALYSEEADVVSAPRHEDWRHADILRDAVALAGPITAEPSPLIIVLPSVPGFDPGGFAVDIIEARLPVRAFGVPVAMDMAEATRLALSGDFIVSKDGWRGRAWWLGSTATLAEELTQPDTELGQAFELKREYALPDGSRALLYQRRSADGA